MAVVPYLQSKCITTCRKFQEHRYKMTYHSVTLSSFGNAFSFDNFSISDLSCNFPSFPNIGNSSAVNTLRSASSVSGFNLNSDALTYPELFVKSKNADYCRNLLSENQLFLGSSTLLLLIVTSFCSIWAIIIQFTCFYTLFSCKAICIELSSLCSFAIVVIMCFLITRTA